MGCLMGCLSVLRCSQMDCADLVSQSPKGWDCWTHKHTHICVSLMCTHTIRGNVTEAATTRCRQDRRRARTPAEYRCQWADHTGRHFRAHAMIYLSALILCSDSITCRSLILYSPTTHTHTHPPLLTIQNPCRTFPRAFQARGAIPGQGLHPHNPSRPRVHRHTDRHTPTPEPGKQPRTRLVTARTPDLTVTEPSGDVSVNSVI